MTRDDSSASESGGFGLLFDAAERLGLQARVLDPAFGYLWELSDGRGHAQAIVGLRVPLNLAAASHLASDKHYASLVLSGAGFRTPRTERALAPRAFNDTSLADRSGVRPAVEFARSEGYPLIVKPNRLSHGRGVARVDSEAELLSAVETVFQLDSIALVQELIHGVEYRLEFLDGEYLVGYERAPTAVTGDGFRTVGELLQSLDPRFTKSKFLSRMQRRGALTQHLVARGFGFDSIVPAGEPLPVEDTVLNLSRGATPVLLDELPDGWLEWAVRAGRALGLRHYGLDFRHIPGEPIERACVLEINSNPAVSHLARAGFRERALESRMRLLSAVANAWA